MKGSFCAKFATVEHPISDIRYRYTDLLIIAIISNDIKVNKNKEYILNNW